VTLELMARGKVCRMRAAESQWNTESLRIPDRDIGAKFARRL